MAAGHDDDNSLDVKRLLIGSRRILADTKCLLGPALARRISAGASMAQSAAMPPPVVSSSLSHVQFAELVEQGKGYA